MTDKKKIEDLVPDIYRVMEDGAVLDGLPVDEFGKTLSSIIAERLNPENRKEAPRLRPSNIGTKCDRKLWFSINHPELAEKLDGQTRLKFLLGDVWEATLLFLARASGHDVTGQQSPVSIGTVSGSRDAVIDGTTIDVKSASSYSFDKFQNHLTPDQDAFGYIPQLQFYLHAGKDDGSVTDSGRAAFLVGDKTLGKITLDVHPVEDIDFKALIKQKEKMLAGPLPPRGYKDEPDGKSGNRKLGVACSYCPFKSSCWNNLRTFLYSGGPRYLTVVERLPDVTEVHS